MGEAVLPFKLEKISLRRFVTVDARVVFPVCYMLAKVLLKRWGETVILST